MMAISFEHPMASKLRFLALHVYGIISPKQSQTPDRVFKSYLNNTSNSNQQKNSTWAMMSKLTWKMETQKWLCTSIFKSKAKAKPNQNHCIAQRGGGRGCVKRQNPSCWMFLKSPFAVFTVNGRDDRSVVFTVNVAVPPCRRGSTVYSCWTSNAPLSYGGLNKSQDRKPLRGFYSSWADLYFSLKNIWVDVPLTPTVCGVWMLASAKQKTKQKTLGRCVWIFFLTNTEI